MRERERDRNSLGSSGVNNASPEPPGHDLLLTRRFISITETRPHISACVRGLRWSANGVYLVMGLNRMERCRVMAALGDDVMKRTHTHTHTRMCDRQQRGLSGIGAHATLASEWRVILSGVSCSGLVVGTERARMKPLTRRSCR